MIELNHLSCPFTWKMEELPRGPESLIKRDNERRMELLVEGNPQDGIIAFAKLLYTVTKAYDFAENHLLENALKEIIKSESVFNDFREKTPNGISMNAVEHVVKATKCFILQKVNKLDDLKNVLKTVPLCEDSFESGTLYGCQSSAWHFYKYVGWQKALVSASVAVQLNPECGLWHFLCAQSLRRTRKYVGNERTPSHEEQAAFETAFKIQPDPVIGIQCASMYHELKENEKARDMCNRVFCMNLSSCIIYLKLALGFIRCRKPTDTKITRNQYTQKIRICLHYVGARMPQNERYLHYRGIYLEKCLRDYKGALGCYEIGGTLLNVASDFSYVTLQMRLTKNDYNAVPYLENMLKRYEKVDAYSIQLTLLNMSAFYHFIRKDEKNACKSYVKAIEIDPQSGILKIFYYNIVHQQLNVFDELRRDILPKLQKQKHDKETCELVRKAEEFCNLHGDKDSNTKESTESSAFN